LFCSSSCLAAVLTTSWAVSLVETSLRVASMQLPVMGVPDSSCSSCLEVGSSVAGGTSSALLQVTAPLAS
jgi:hypothetical protein